MILFNPNTHNRPQPDGYSDKIMQKTIAFFEKKGLRQIKKDYHDKVWYQDFVDFLKEEKIFAELLTPTGYGTETSRWDTWRIQEFSEILGFYGLPYWYVWQVTILGLGPIWMSDNEKLKQQAAKMLLDGEVFAFGLSERNHGADIYSTDTVLTTQPDGSYIANGSKYYIGNANKAGMVSTFGRIAETNEYVFFNTSYRSESYELVKNTVASQNFVGEYLVNNFKLTADDLLHKGDIAWDSALNTVNIGKYNLGWASIGMCTHAFYEAITHASGRKLYNMHVTDFSHVKRMFVDAWARLVAMKLFAMRAADYMRTANAADRRYLLYNPVMKMKVTTQGEEVINLLWDVIAAKGFEADVFFEMAAIDIRALPKLEGTVHVNIALIVKFMKNFFFGHTEYPEVPIMNKAANDDFLFHQGPTKGLSQITFHNYKKAYELFDTPNLKIFKEQIAVFKESLIAAPVSEAQQRDTDFLLSVGELFTLIVYGQLVLENAKLYEVPTEAVDQIFEFMVRDFSKFALEIYNRQAASEAQAAYCLKMIRKSHNDTKRYLSVLKNFVYSQAGAYEMKA